MRVKVEPTAVRRAFEPLRHSTAFSESAARVAAGHLPLEMLQAMSLRPELLAAFGAVSEAIYPGGIVEREIKELIILDVSIRNRCQFCADSHIDMARALGMGDDASQLLDNLAALPERQRIAVEYARAVTRDANALPESLWQKVHAVFSDAEVVELTAITGLITMLNLFNNALGVRYHSTGSQPSAAG
ncbi:MAG: carboxymuconolactone decarboxylase family protein [Phycisphaeraceae bacterium]|nr:carboxymuconolactone decarboxylase family protein [Phycisphaeraceae bacterium]